MLQIKRLNKEILQENKDWCRSNPRIDGLKMVAWHKVKKLENKRLVVFQKRNGWI